MSTQIEKTCCFFTLDSKFKQLTSLTLPWFTFSRLGHLTVICSLSSTITLNTLYLTLTTIKFITYIQIYPNVNHPNFI